jgi:peroxiredoxin
LLPDGKPAELMEDEDLDLDEKPLTAEEEQKLKEQFERSKSVRKERNLQIIKLAESCIAATAKKPEQEGEFDAAVHYLLDARLQLALQGDAASIDAVYDAAKVFYERKPQSASAVEAQLTLVNLTHANALRYGQTQPKWIQEFAKHTQLFANRFPEEQARSVTLLAAAARTCELAGQLEDAKSCYSLLVTKFKDTPQAQQAQGVARRLQLKGKVLELAGPTMDGDDLNIESLRGKMVVVVFWATHARPFIEQLPKLTATMKKYEKYATVVGVNLDADETAVEAFLEKSSLTWPQIFSPNRALRGWNSPLAVHYGINTLPTIWLVDPTGVVTDTTLDADHLEPRLREVYLPFLKNAVKPASATK